MPSLNKTLTNTYSNFKPKSIRNKVSAYFIPMSAKDTKLAMRCHHVSCAFVRDNQLSIDRIKYSHARPKWAFAILAKTFQQNASYLKLFREMSTIKLQRTENYYYYYFFGLEFHELEFHVKYSSSQNSSSLKKIQVELEFHELKYFT